MTQLSGFSSLSRIDHVGAAVSFVCAVHCVAMPFLLSMFPLLGLQFLAHEGLEWAMIVAAFGGAILSCAGGLRVHGRRRILLAFGSGAVLIVLSPLFADPTHGIVIGLGGVVLSASHLLNRRWCRCCSGCEVEKSAAG